jgi:hypothetical protein
MVCRNFTSLNDSYLLPAGTFLPSLKDMDSISNRLLSKFYRRDRMDEVVSFWAFF